MAYGRVSPDSAPIAGNGVHRSISARVLETRPSAFAVVMACVLALAIAGPAAASPTSVDRSKFEGRVATANWDACAGDSCFRTTATVSVGTVTANGVAQPSTTVTVSRRINPRPVEDSSRVLFAGFSDPSAHVATDLSSAHFSGNALVYSQDCTATNVCHGASFEPLGTAHVAASWDATGAPRRFQEHEQHDVSRLTFEECVYSTTASGWRRPADASLVITKLEDFGEWDWPLGSLTSASISEVKSIFVRRCKSPF